MNHDGDQSNEQNDQSSGEFNSPGLDTLKNRMNLELDTISANQLYALATEAMEKKLISAHGYRSGQYELLCQGEFILLSPQEALQYLQRLVEQATDS